MAVCTSRALSHERLERAPALPFEQHRISLTRTPLLSLHGASLCTWQETPSYPRKIFFCCLDVAPVGGETPFLLNAELTAKIDDDVLVRFAARGVRYKQVLPGGGRRGGMVENLGGEQVGDGVARYVCAALPRSWCRVA